VLYTCGNKYWSTQLCHQGWWMLAVAASHHDLWKCGFLQISMSMHTVSHCCSWCMFLFRVLNATALKHLLVINTNRKSVSHTSVVYNTEKFLSTYTVDMVCCHFTEWGSGYIVLATLRLISCNVISFTSIRYGIWMIFRIQHLVRFLNHYDTYRYLGLQKNHFLGIFL